VATDWGPLLQTGIGAAAAVAGGLLTAWYQNRVHERAEQQRRKERAAEVVTAAFEFHLDTDPETLAGMNKQELMEATDRLLARASLLRTQFIILTASYPSRRVRNLARDLPHLLMDRLNSSFTFALARLDADPSAQEAAEKTTKAADEKALDALADLTTAIEID
jgi:hypothetical protein